MTKIKLTNKNVEIRLWEEAEAKRAAELAFRIYSECVMGPEEMRHVLTATANRDLPLLQAFLDDPVNQP